MDLNRTSYLIREREINNLVLPYSKNETPKNHLVPLWAPWVPMGSHHGPQGSNGPSLQDLQPRATPKNPCCQGPREPQKMKFKRFSRSRPEQLSPGNFLRWSWIWHRNWVENEPKHSKMFNLRVILNFIFLLLIFNRSPGSPGALGGTLGRPGPIFRAP